MNVVVPPDILNQPDINDGSMVNVNMEEGISNEGGVIQLICSATGIPEPTVQWNREDGKDIILRSESTREKQGKKKKFMVLSFVSCGRGFCVLLWNLSFGIFVFLFGLLTLYVVFGIIFGFPFLVELKLFVVYIYYIFGFLFI